MTRIPFSYLRYCVEFSCDALIQIPTFLADTLIGVPGSFSGEKMIILDISNSGTALALEVDESHVEISKTVSGLRAVEDNTHSKLFACRTCSEMRELHQI